MQGRLDGRIAVVTGAGTGIGAGIARRFAREGARVVVAERNTETGTRTVAEAEALGAEALFVATDVTVRDQAVVGSDKKHGFILLTPARLVCMVMQVPI